MTTVIPLSQKEIVTRLKGSEVTVKSWEELHTSLGGMSDTAWIFRGVSSPEHYPIPSIGRKAIYGPYYRAQEERLLLEFKYRAVALMRAPDFDDWHWLAYAQHLGVPTRLLDWTTSPLIAAFFALQGDMTSDRAIFCVKYSRFIHEIDQKTKSPFDCASVGRFSPPLIFDRLRAQRGLFTVHPHPTMIFYSPGMKVIRIARDGVEKLRKRLFKYGIDYWYIYPDAEGLGEQLRWQYKTKIGLGSIALKRK
ncbi:MAG: FRG domain-containing protein [Candidatus Korobacteraceae bacterium]|jgi:FRG domain-containing protein